MLGTCLRSARPSALRHVSSHRLTSTAECPFCLFSFSSSPPRCASFSVSSHFSSSLPGSPQTLQPVCQSSPSSFLSSACLASTSCRPTLAGRNRSLSLISFRGGIPQDRHFSGTAGKPDIVRMTDSEIKDLLNGPSLTPYIRNFGIIAHVDHGKSTLADRFLELTGSIRPLANEQAQVLDTLQVERERGITIKAATASMFYKDQQSGQGYLLNLIDTPGHVDFSYEVSRSLAACEGVLLLVDASQGIQAQTLANFYLAFEGNLAVVPVLTKMDLPHAEPEEVMEQLMTACDVDPEDVLTCSSKTGVGVRDILPAICCRIPAPQADEKQPFRALLFDSWFSSHRGVVCLIRVQSGVLRVGDRIETYHAQGTYEVQEVGLLRPAPTPLPALRAGQVGYLLCQMKTSTEAKLGDTFFKVASALDKQTSWSRAQAQKIRQQTQPNPDFKPAVSMVFAALYPSSDQDFEDLCQAMDKLLLTDGSVSASKEMSAALGPGFRCGFLGALHMDVFKTRLEQEFGAEVILTGSTVRFQARPASNPDKIISISSPNDFPDSNKDKYIYEEPMVTASIITPDRCLQVILDLCTRSRGKQIGLEYLSKGRVILRYRLPLAELVTDFNDQLKALSSGYASFDYEEAGYEPADLVRLDIKINGESVDPLSSVIPRDRAEQAGRALALKLKKAVDRQSFEVVIQAAIGPKIVARERIPPFRKDVLTKSGKTVGGGDKTRKAKLLAKQKEGKKKMKAIGNIQLNESVFSTVMKRE